MGPRPDPTATTDLVDDEDGYVAEELREVGNRPRERVDLLLTLRDQPDLVRHLAHLVVVKVLVGRARTPT